MAKKVEEVSLDGVEDAPKKKSKLKVIIPVLVLIAGLGGGGYFFVLAPKQAAAAAEAASTTTELELGKLVRLAPITMNLSDGHILKVGLGLQLVAAPHDHELDALFGAAAAAGGHGGGGEVAVTTTMGGLEAKALDETIAELGNSTYDELSKPGGRTAAKHVLAEKIKEIYHGDVVEVYFTDFVMS